MRIKILWRSNSEITKKMKLKLNIYEKLFLGTFSSISRTNKSIPEWSTIICISTLIFINLVSLLKLINYNFKHVDRELFQASIFLIIILNWFYFLKNNRIQKKLKKVKYKLKTIEKIIIGLYSFGSALFFFIVLEIQFIPIIITFGALFTIMFFVYKFGSKPITFD